jgi:alanyl-tRNA synthetase
MQGLPAAGRLCQNSNPKMSQPTFSVADIRKSFLDFFASKGHTVVPDRKSTRLNSSHK